MVYDHETQEPIEVGTRLNTKHVKIDKPVKKESDGNSMNLVYSLLCLAIVVAVLKAM